MKYRIYSLLLLVCGILAAHCSDSKNDLPEEVAPNTRIPESEEENYTSFWYYSYEAVQTIDHETMGLETSEQFSPYAVAHRGDTLFVANSGTAGNSLIVFSQRRIGRAEPSRHGRSTGRKKISPAKSMRSFRRPTASM